ncbi:MAG: putative toxin-antitoxin system toxin component, PIN family [Crocosphaera sp.]|nr:putative toxin-antitoxin system toxin component, PIN family [Crocosphaera sp.]
MSPNKIVIDTNVFISALLNPLGTPKQVIEIAVNHFTILQSESTYQELETRISKKKFDKYLEKNDRLDFLLAIKYKSSFIDICHQTIICSDSDDNKFLELAVSGIANYIITGDNDLLTIKSYQEIEIIKPINFLNLFDDF